jgi:signal transduction histidine kinase
MNKITKFWKIMTTPAWASIKDGITYWQEKVFWNLLFTSVVFGAVTLVPSVALSIKEKLWIIAVFNILIYFSVVFIYLKKNLSYNFRATFISIIPYILGMALITTLGPFGAGPVWLFCFPVITGILLGYKKAGVALIINALTIISLAFLIHQNLTDPLLSLNFKAWHPVLQNPLQKWIVISLNFMLLNFISTLSTTTILKGLQQSYIELESQVKKRTTELLKTNHILTGEIAERKAAELKLIEFNKALDKKIREKTIDLHNLNDHLIHIEEIERKRIASDLHDGVVQNLAMSVFNLKNLQEQGKEIKPHALSNIQEIIEQSITEIRLMINQLFPPVINDFGIDIAIGHLVEKYNEMNKTQIIFLSDDFECYLKPSEIIKITIYRAASELIINFIKYSGIKKAVVEISNDHQNIYLKVEDEGLGFKFSEIKRNLLGGFGLYGLSARCNNMGGSVQINSAPGEGTKILVHLPVV